MKSSTCSARHDRPTRIGRYLSGPERGPVRGGRSRDGGTPHSRRNEVVKWL